MTALLASNTIFAQTDLLAALAAEEVELVANLSRLVRDRIAPAAGTYDMSAEFPWDNVKLLNDLGLNAMFIPEDYGGMPLSFAAYLMCLREISRGCASTGLIWATNFHAIHPVVDAADNALKARVLPGISAGGLAAVAITEATGGSDATSMRTVFEDRGDKIAIRGEKIYITNGDVADLILLFGKWRDSNGPRESIMAVVVDTAETLVTARRRENKLGHRASSTVALEFDNALIPVANVLAGPGKGYGLLIKGLARSRVSVAAHSLGIARAALDDIFYVGAERRIAGKSLLEYQMNQVSLAGIVSDVLMCETMLWALARPDQVRQPNFGVLASLLKLRSADVAVAAADFALQLCGGAGYCREYRAERLWRDARLAPVGEGARELLATVAGKWLVRLATEQPG